MRITFLGAAETVTGSRFLLESGGTKVLVDCGLFQGLKALRLRNREPFPVDPKTLDAVILTHAHLDHSGYLPALLLGGFRGPVFATPGTIDLCRILLPDSGHLQEEEARFTHARGSSKHHPTKPLYTAKDGEHALRAFRAVRLHEVVEIGAMRFEFSRAGHILGSACVRIEDGTRSVLFSGDLGRPEDPVMRPPAPPLRSDVVVVETTYGNRRRSPRDPMEQLGEVIRRTTDRGGAVLIPSFAVGRTQTVLHMIAELSAVHEIPDLPVYINSPMAIDATSTFLRHEDEHRLSAVEIERMRSIVRYVRTPAESKALTQKRGPMVVISASGMATGGRVLHHLIALAPEAKNSIVFVGFQAAGTRGQALVGGVDQIKIFGSYVPVRAEVVQIEALSAHADWHELIDWLRPLQSSHPRCFLVHGEPIAQDAFRVHLADELGWEATIPSQGQAFRL